MGNNEADSGKKGNKVPIQQGRIERLPDESEQAHAAMRAYCELEPASGR